MFKIIFSCFSPTQMRCYENLEWWPLGQFLGRRFLLDFPMTESPRRITWKILYATRPDSTILWFGFDGQGCPDQLMSSSTSNAYPRKYFLEAWFQESNPHQLCGTHEPTRLTLIIEENTYPRKYFLAAIPRIKPSPIVWNPRTNQANPRDWRKLIPK